MARHRRRQLFADPQPRSDIGLSLSLVGAKHRLFDRAGRNDGERRQAERSGCDVGFTLVHGAGGDSPANCQFGNSGRNNFRGPRFTDSEIYLTKNIPITERVTFRFDTQFFNVFNHPNFALPTNQAGTPGEPATQTGFGALTSTISPPTGLLGVGLGGDSSPRMIAFQGRIEF